MILGRPVNGFFYDLIIADKIAYSDELGDALKCINFFNSKVLVRFVYIRYKDFRFNTTN